MREKSAQAMKNHPQTVMVALVLRLLSWSGLAIAEDCLDRSKEWWNN
ncbi:MAG: hypothetical protein GPJ21_21370 [Microcystis aeruginosa W13-11]|nr:hypothetical protein [Microcystis aeruginosa W13-11]